MHVKCHEFLGIPGPPKMQFIRKKKTTLHSKRVLAWFRAWTRIILCTLRGSLLGSDSDFKKKFPISFNPVSNLVSNYLNLCLMIGVRMTDTETPFTLTLSIEIIL